jgi:ribosome-associated toxin RatA of RatAB toxin-antitoxin module
MASEHPCEASGSIRVNAPRARVWAVLSDFHNVDAWAERVRRVEAVGSVGHGLGAQRQVWVKGAGRLRETVVCFEEQRRFGYRVSPIGPIGEALSLWTVEPAGEDACDVTLQLQYRLRFGLIGRVLHDAIARRLIVARVAPVLAALKHYAETGRMLRTGRESPQQSV